jgi:serine/threonine protein kinase
VYKAFDPELHREVAIKLTAPPRKQNNLNGMFVSEARILAELDHKNIVPVFDVGTTQDGENFIVSKFIDGTDLKKRIELGRPDVLLSLRIVADIADALSSAHLRGLIHRDVKPANILLGENDYPYLADFGIALRSTEQELPGCLTGSPAYMSPEQARCEGHLMSPRSDIYSLGVVLYELLIGRRQFVASTQEELLSLIRSADVQPVRQLNPKISVEVERVCMKALARRPSDRYADAAAFARDIRWAIECESESNGANDLQRGTAKAFGFKASMKAARTGKTPITDLLLDYLSQDSEVLSPVVPRGLQSFEADDSDFFMRLLPGPYNREGIPEAVDFWRQRLEIIAIGKTFRVGLMYGPSGCGKSSLMKAGLLPRLSKNIVPIYLEATPNDTERQLLDAICTRIPELSSLNIVDAISSIRGGSVLQEGCKLLIVIDQFEQWLFSHDDYSNEQLTSALRQCDGVATQAVLMVRDDFWVSVSRFLYELDIPILERVNSSMVDLFDLDHSKKVLALFGQAYGRLPRDVLNWTKDHHAFCHAAVEAMSNKRKVIPVQIALFAEMMKSREWTRRSISALGGISGVGVSYLDELFGERHTPIQYRNLREASRRILTALLPPKGVEIKGVTRSRSELRERARYQDGDQEFDNAITLLHQQLKLVTAIDKAEFVVAEKESSDRSLLPSSESREILPSSSRRNGEAFFQLTHDYLVPSLREWITKKQRETREGRAELKLAELTALWSPSKEKKYLPSLTEWIAIRVSTQKARWEASERSMMGKAFRVHFMNLALFACCLLTLGLLTRNWIFEANQSNRKRQIRTTIDNLENNLGVTLGTNITTLKNLTNPKNISDVTTELRKRFDTSDNPRHKLALALALAEFGLPDVDFLVENIDMVDPSFSQRYFDALSKDTKLALEVLGRASARCDGVSDFRRKAKVAVVAFLIGDGSVALEMCKAIPKSNQNQLHCFIEELPRWGLGSGEGRLNMDRLYSSCSSIPLEEAAELRAAICIAVRGLSLNLKDGYEQGPARRWVGLVNNWRQTDASAYVRSSSEWLLREWNAEIISDQESPPKGSQWFINKVGMRLLRVDRSAEDSSGDIEDKSDPKAGESLWLGATEVSRGQFESFFFDKSVPQEDKPTYWLGVQAAVSPTVHHPVHNVSRDDAIKFCNWLSKSDGLPVSYKRRLKNPQGGKSPDASSYEWELVPDPRGYRLPTEEEWERACRSRTRTDWSSGNDATLLPMYCHMFPADGCAIAGKKLMNASGFFDMHGNVWEWCEDTHKGFGVFRGGSWKTSARECRSESRMENAPTLRSNDLGFRIAITR